MSPAMGEVEPLLFRCEGHALVGILHRAAAEPAEVAVLVVVGGPQYRVGSHRQFVSSARALAAAGVPTLRFDYRGMGDSAGDNPGFERVAADIRAAIDALMGACRPRRGVVLLGLCDAASAALMYCGSDPRVAGLILMNPWVRSGQSQAEVVVRKYYAARLLQGDFWRKLLGGGFDFTGSVKALVGNLVRATVRQPPGRGEDYIEAMRLGLTQFHGPMLIVLSGRDLTADEFRARCRSDDRWRRGLARGDVEVVELPTADHTFSGSSELAAFNGHCCRWLTRQFGDSPCH